jgi:Sulfotransferase family
LRGSLWLRIVGRLRERRGARAPRLAHPADRPPTVKSPPIFIIGCQRSGTSLLRRIMDSHSRIACPPESKFILPLIQILRDRQAMRGLDSLGYPRAEVAGSLAAFISGFFEQYASAQGKSRWADKTPNYVNCLDELWELFGPDARFVLIIRHGMDTAYSLADPGRSYRALARFVDLAGGDVPLAAGTFWKDQNEKIEAFRTAHPEACIRIRYEDLTRNPSDTLQPIFGFVGEPWEPEVIDFNRHPHHAGIEDPETRRRHVITPNSGRHTEWPEAVQRKVRAACEPMLAALGYA